VENLGRNDPGNSARVQVNEGLAHEDRFDRNREIRHNYLQATRARGACRGTGSVWLRILCAGARLRAQKRFETRCIQGQEPEQEHEEETAHLFLYSTFGLSICQLAQDRDPSAVG
jgi:hypothetical protein